MNGKNRFDDLLTLGAALDAAKLAIYGAQTPGARELAWRNYRRANAAYISAAMRPSQRHDLPLPKKGPLKGRRRSSRQPRGRSGDAEWEQLGLSLAS